MAASARPAPAPLASTTGASPSTISPPLMRPRRYPFAVRADFRRRPPAPIDEAELEIEAAQNSALIAGSRLTLARLAWTGLGGLVSLALGLWATNLIEGLFARAELLGIVGVVFGLVFLVGVIGVAAREMVAVARQTRIAEMHVAFAQARAADDRLAARRLVSQLVALYRDRPETARARARSRTRRARSSTGATSSTSLSARC